MKYLVLAFVLAGCATNSTETREPASAKAVPNPSNFNVYCAAVTPMSVRFSVVLKKSKTEATLTYSSHAEEHAPQTIKVKMTETAQAYSYTGANFELTMPKNKFTTNGVGNTLAVSNFNGQIEGSSIPYHEINCVFEN